MNRDINDIRIEYRDLVSKAWGMRKVYRNDVVDLVRAAAFMYNYIKRIDPTWLAPMEAELREMVETFTTKKVSR